MSIRVRQILFGILALSAALVGLWAEFLPHDWYTSFPGFGMRWVRPLGPYNEHLTRDVGSLYLALLVLSLGVLYRPTQVYVSRLVAAGWVTFSTPHLIFHLAHLDMFNTRDQIGNVVTLGGTLAVALVLLAAPYATP